MATNESYQTVGFHFSVQFLCGEGILWMLGFNL